MTEPMTKPLRDLGSGAGPASRLGQVVRAMHAPPSLSREARARILRQLRHREAGSSPWPRRWFTFSAAAAALLLFAAGAKALVANVVAWRHERQSVRQVEPSTVRTVPSRVVSRRAPVHHEPEGEPQELPVPQALSPAVKPSVPVRAQDPVSSVGGESRMLARAIQKLRQDHDAQGALAALDRYRVRFPHGVLQDEATLVRLEALTNLGDSHSAQATLDGVEISGPRAIELWVSRAELRAHRGWCREAIGDFDRALERQAGGRWGERALRGRAACHRQLGERAAARTDAQEYLSRFPAGEFADEMRRGLSQ